MDRIPKGLMGLCGLLFLTSMASQAHAKAQAQVVSPLIQVNVPGAVFSGQVWPGTVGTDFFFPDATYLDEWRTRHIKIVRFPVLWERLQPTLNSSLDPTYAGLIDTFLNQASARGITVILDIHNYGLYRGQPFGSAAVPLSAYTNLMSRVADRWRQNPGLHGYDIMNEPHDGSDAIWPKAAQAAINGVRSADHVKPIYVEGHTWASSLNWAKLNSDLLTLKDPDNNLVFSAHLYIDPDASGAYTSGPAANFDTQIGVTRAQPFVNWLVQNHKQGQIGEFGIPDNDPRWITAMTQLAKYLKVHCVPLAYWAVGKQWGDYPLSIEPVKGVDRPQWTALAPFANSGGCVGGVH